MAARIRRELGVEVETVKGSYGVYQVLVDDEVIVDGGTLVTLGIMPPARKTVAAVRTRLSPHAE